MRLPALALAAILPALPAVAGPDEAEWEIGSSFSSPSKNIYCNYYDAGGETGTAFHDQKSEMHCIRMQPAPLLVILTGKGVLKINRHPSKAEIETHQVAFNDVVLAYGETDKSGVHICLSTTKGMQCTVKGKGFLLSKSGVERVP